VGRGCKGQRISWGGTVYSNTPPQPVHAVLTQAQHKHTSGAPKTKLHETAALATQSLSRQKSETGRSRRWRLTLKYVWTMSEVPGLATSTVKLSSFTTSATTPGGSACPSTARRAHLVAAEEAGNRGTHIRTSSGYCQGSRAAAASPAPGMTGSPRRSRSRRAARCAHRSRRI